MLNSAYIDLNLLRSNARNVRKKLDKGVLFNAVVKADAYGHGAEKVASALYGIVDGFSVALLEEAIKLRLSGIDKDVLVLIPLATSEVRRAVEYSVTATVTNLKHLLTLEKECKRQDRRIKVHVKFNTGMNRLGTNDLLEFERLVDRITESKYLILDGIYSHFACPENKKALKEQENRFILANNLVKGYNNKVTAHISASGGFLSGVQYDMVRIGLLLYGYKPFDSDYISVKPIMKIYSAEIEKRNLALGDSALYGLKRADFDSQISIVRYGYADGLPRKEEKSIFNNRCMDLSAYVDCKVSKRGVLVMDDANHLASLNGTISYEILTKCAMRAQKIYIN